jgi:L-fucose isomerase-like protein
MLGNFEKEAEDMAVSLSENAKNWLINDLGVELYSNLKAVTNLEEARKEAEYFNRSGIDALVLFNGTFSLGNLMVEIIRNANVPILAWGLEEYLIKKGILSGSMIGLMPVGMICNNLQKTFSFAYGEIRNTDVQRKLRIFKSAINALVYMKESKLGLIGSRPDGFEISGFDELAIKKIFGTTINKVSISELLDAIDSTNDKEVEDVLAVHKKLYNLSDVGSASEKDLAKVYVGTKKVVTKYGINSYAPQCWPELRMNRKTPMCAANGRLTDEGIMASCEADMDCTLTMLMLHSLTGNTPWTADFVNAIKENDTLLFWHCGNAPPSLSVEKPKIEVVYEGPAQTASLKEGVVTICRINHNANSFKIHAGLATAIKEKPMFRGSNMYVRMNVGNMEYVEKMLNEGIPHHNVLVYGDATEEIKEFAKFARLPVVIEK